MKAFHFPYTQYNMFFVVFFFCVRTYYNINQSMGAVFVRYDGACAGHVVMYMYMLVWLLTALLGDEREQYGNCQ